MDKCAWCDAPARCVEGDLYVHSIFECGSYGKGGKMTKVTVECRLRRLESETTVAAPTTGLRIRDRKRYREMLEAAE